MVSGIIVSPKKRKLKQGSPAPVWIPSTTTTGGNSIFSPDDDDTKLTERERVFSEWPKMTEEERLQVCRTCTSYFPKEEGKFECLSGHGPHFNNKPCPSFSHAVLRLCEDWDYTPRQVFLLRELEKLCKQAVGEWDDDDED